MTPNELLESVRGWIGVLAGRYARQHGLDREDLFQQIALRVLTAADTYNPDKGAPSTWTTWVARTVVGRMAAVNKRHRRAVQGGSMDDQPDDDHDSDAGESPHLDALPAALDGLDAREREVLSRRYGLAHHAEQQAQIGARLGVSRQRIHQIESRAKKRLRRAILAAARRDV